MIEVRTAVGPHRVPHREWHAEVALAADTPIHVQVFRPAPVAQTHEVGVPLDTVSHFEQALLLIQEAYKPLARRNELEGLFPFFEELDGMFDRLGFSGQSSGGAELLHDELFGLLNVSPGEGGIGLVGCGCIAGFPSLRSKFDGHKTAIPADHLPERKALLAPPENVCGIAEGADHQNAGALLGIHLPAGKYRHGNVENRRDGMFSEEMLKASVVGMGRDTHASRQ